jgi:hypothetical protein
MLLDVQSSFAATHNRVKNISEIHFAVRRRCSSALELALELYEEKGNVLGADRARAALASRRVN